jgi:hypothetical protein
MTNDSGGRLVTNRQTMHYKPFEHRDGYQRVIGMYTFNHLPPLIPNPTCKYTDRRRLYTSAFHRNHCRSGNFMALSNFATISNRTSPFTYGRHSEEGLHRRMSLLCGMHFIYGI